MSVNITRRGKQNAISRRLNTENNNGAISTWRSDLNKILHVFNVRSITLVRLSLAFRLQTEPRTNTQDPYRDTSNPETIVHDVRPNVSSTPHFF